MRSAFTIISLFICIASIAQIRGVVYSNEEKKPLEYANVIFTTHLDSSVIAYAVTDSSGHFLINNVKENYHMKVSFLGYKTYETDVVPDTDLGIIYLQKDEKILGEVTVKAKRYVRTQKGLSVNVNKTVLGKLGDAMDVLKHIPFVITKNNEISVIGKGEPIIYINNRKLQDNDELKQIRSYDIKKIEVITNPSAEYDATTNAVIKIYTSRPVGEGLSGSIDMGIEAERKVSHKGGVQLNYRIGGLDLFSTLRYNHENYKYDHTTDTQYSNWKLSEIEKTQGRNTIWNSTIGFNYQYYDKLSFGMQYKNYFTPHTLYQNVLDMIVSHDSKLRNAFVSNDSRSSKSNRHYTNLYFTYNFSEETFLQLDADYFEYSKDLYQDYYQDSEEIHSITNSNNKLYAAKLKYITSVASGTLNTGIEGSQTHNINKYNILENTTLNNELSNSNNTVKQHIFAAFFEYERQLGKGWSANAGGRFEHVGFNYISVNANSTKYFSNGLFPSATINYENGNINFSLAYRNTTKRPSYFALRSSVEYNNPYCYEGGTPDLQDKRTNMLSFSLGWKDLQIAANYSFISNGYMYLINMYQNSDSIIIFHTENINHHQTLNMSAIYSPTLFDIWNPTFTIDVTKPYITYNRQNYNKPIWTLDFDNTINLPCNFTLGADINWTSDGNADWDLSYYYSDFYFSAYCIRSFLNDKLRIKLGIENAFNTSREKWLMETNGISMAKWRNYGRRMVELTVTYTFNPAKKKYKGEAASNEIQRM